jgi:hypothetical protein
VSHTKSHDKADNSCRNERYCFHRSDYPFLRYQFCSLLKALR